MATTSSTNITRLNDGTYKAFVLNHNACNNMNKRFRQYTELGKLYKFSEGEEGVFRFTTMDLKFVVATLGTFDCLE